MRHRIEIHPLEKGPGVRFMLDDTDVANQIMSYTVRHEASGVPSVQVEFGPHRFQAVFEHADVEIDPETAELLVKLGWTPPTVGDAA